MPFQMCKKKLLIFNNLMCDYEKLKMCKCLLTGCVQKCAFRFLMSQVFQKAKNYLNPTTESGSKQRSSLLQEKVVIQALYLMTQPISLKARFRPKGKAMGIQENSKISIASDQQFLSCVKKNYRRAPPQQEQG